MQYLCQLYNALAIFLDVEKEYIYIKKLIWYTDAKTDEKDLEKLNEIISTNLQKEEGEENMRTIAQHYIEQGIERGMERGIERGMERGKMARDAEIVKNMLSMNRPIEDIKMITRLSEEQIASLLVEESMLN